jgi:hypothetical protein
MSVGWIKMRVDLATCPQVVRMTSALRTDRLRVVGALHAVWCIFDAHSVAGVLDAYTAETLDQAIGFEGFAEAMKAAGWLEVAETGLAAPRYEEHNGSTAKRRGMEALRKRVERAASKPTDPGRNASAADADKKRTREEKRRITSPTPSLVACGDWRSTRSGIEAMGQRFGFSPWDEAAFNIGRGESFGEYERRVCAAADQQPNSQTAKQPLSKGERAQGGAARRAVAAVEGKAA